MLFVGYEGNSANDRVFNPETKAVTVSRNVVFNEKRSEVRPSPVDTEIDELTFSVGGLGRDNEELVQEDRAQDVLVEPAVDNVPAEPAVGNAPAVPAVAPDDAEEQQPLVEPRRLRDRATLKRSVRYGPEWELNLVVHETPANFREAISGENASKWIDAVKEELAAHKKNNT